MPINQEKLVQKPERLRNNECGYIFQPGPPLLSEAQGVSLGGILRAAFAKERGFNLAE